MDKNVSVPDFSAWLSLPGGVAGYGVLYIVNHAQLLLAYGDSDFPAELERALVDRLSVYGIERGDLLMQGARMLVRLSEEVVVRLSSRGLLSDELAQVLSHEPISCHEHHVFVQMSVAWLGLSVEIPSESAMALSGLTNTARLLAQSEVACATPEQIRADMAAAYQRYQQRNEADVVPTSQAARRTQETAAGTGEAFAAQHHQETTSACLDAATHAVPGHGMTVPGSPSLLIPPLFSEDRFSSWSWK